MNILMLSDLYPPFLGGIERHVQSLSRALSERGHKVVICTIGRQDLPRYEREGEVEVHRWEGMFQKVPFLFRDPARKWHPPVSDWRIGKGLAQLIEKVNPDIIHAHGWIVYSALALERGAGIPLAFTIHVHRAGAYVLDKFLSNQLCLPPRRALIARVRALTASST